MLAGCTFSTELKNTAEFRPGAIPKELDWFNCMFGIADAMKLLSTYDDKK